MLIPLVYAQDYDDYKSLTLDFSINSDVKIVSKGDNPLLKESEIKLNLFPKTNYRQNVIEFKATSNPDIWIDVNDNIRYTWDDVRANKLSFGLKSKIITYNKLKKIKSKISFPVNNIRDYEDYLEETEYININNDITSKAHEIASGETDLFIAAYKLAEWVRTNVRYDINTLTEKAVQKSSWVLKNKEGVCDEITNLFISFCRSIGIPAKFVAGVVYSEETKEWGNHGWSEVYFPGTGWIPFDVTYGEYGWLDATHLKLMESYDSNEYSVQYNWKSRDVDIEPQELKIKTNLLDKGDLLYPYLNLKANLFSDEVNFGSSVPLQVIVENPNDFYVSSKISLVKGPSDVEDNVKTILLKPKETKQVYWVIKVPGGLDSSYTYTSLVKVVGSFGESSETILKFANKYSFYSKKKAEKEINKLKERETKKYFSDVDLKCLTDKNSYYSDEVVELICILENKGNTYLKDLSVCLKNKCKDVSLSIGEKEEFKFKTDVSEKISIIVESKDMIKYSFIDLNVIKIPEVFVTDVRPRNIDYYKKVKLALLLSSKYEAYDVNVLIKGVGTFKFNELKEKEIIFDVEGKKLLGGLRLNINYKDSAGKVYTKKQNYTVKVLNAPWYGYILAWFYGFI